MLPSFLLFTDATCSTRCSRRRQRLRKAGAASTGQVVAVRPEPPSLRCRRRYRSRNCRIFQQSGRRRRAAVNDSPNDEEERDEAIERELRAIREQVERLEQRRGMLESAMVTARSNAVGHSLKQVEQFYTLFAHGYDPAKSPVQGREQARFVRGMMEENVVCSEFRGVETFLDQYLAGTTGHASMRLTVQDIWPVNEVAAGRKLPESTIQVRANAVVKFRVSRATLSRFFPSLVADEPLTQQLVGKEYMFRYDKVFHFRHGRVFQHESKSDFCSGMLQLVQNPFVAATLLDAWVMTKGGHLRVDPRIVENQHQLEDAVL